jgi:hypothetical protein
MAKKIKEIHDQINLLTTKGRTGYHSPGDIDIAVYKASKELYNLYFKEFEANNALHDSLRPFATNPTVIALNGSGQYTLPADFIHDIGEITSGSSDIIVDVVDRAALALRRADALVPPSASYPICTFYETYIQFYPINITNVKFAYLKKPIQPVYAYTIVSGRAVYDDTNSVDVEWNETDIGEVMVRTLSMLGVNLEDMKLVQWSEAQQQKT